MAGFFDDERKAFEELRDEIPNTIRKTLERFDFVILDYIANKQLDQKREDGNGKTLGPYSVNYARFRIKKGLQAESVDTHLTGKFHASLYIETYGDSFSIGHNVEYGDHLLERYGIDILNIQDQYLTEFVENYIIPEINKTIDDKLSKIN